jgi:ABC-type transport system involved in Fe-S cluster assembly fused permease/ATPase subunit
VFKVRHVLGLSTRYHNERNTGELISILGRADSAADFLDFVIFQLFPIFVDMGVGAIYFGIVYGWVLVAVLGLTCATYATVTTLTRPRLLRLQALKKDQEDKNAGLKNEAISQIELVRYMAAERYELFRLEKAVASTQSVSLEESIYYASIEFNQFLTLHLGGSCSGCPRIAL